MQAETMLASKPSNQLDHNYDQNTAEVLIFKNFDHVSKGEQGIYFTTCTTTVYQISPIIKCFACAEEYKNNKSKHPNSKENYLTEYSVYDVHICEICLKFFHLNASCL